MNALFIAVCLAVVMCAGASASCSTMSDANLECHPQYEAYMTAQDEYYMGPPDMSNEAACSAWSAVRACVVAKACPSEEKDDYLGYLQEEIPSLQCATV